MTPAEIKKELRSDWKTPASKPPVMEIAANYIEDLESLLNECKDVMLKWQEANRQLLLYHQHDTMADNTRVLSKLKKICQ